MKNRFLVLTALLLAALFLVSCNVSTSKTTASEAPTAQSPEPVDTPAMQNSPSSMPTAQSPEPSEIGAPAVPSYPLYFPMPYYRTFFGSITADNLDAFLHDTAVNYYTARDDARSGSLLLVSLRLLDEWDAGDGATYYLCQMATYDYYDLARQLIKNGGNHNITYGDGVGGYSLGSLVRFKVTPYDYNNKSTHYITNYWGFSAVEILEQPSVGNNGKDIKELCGGRPICQALLDAYCGTGDKRPDVPYLRDILPGEYAHDAPAMLEKYLEAYFPEFCQ